MALQGDLSTLELADIIQNLEMHRRSGTLVIDHERGSNKIYFRDGAIALYAGDGRPDLVEDLVRAGFVPEKLAEQARKPLWRKRRPVSDVLVKKGAIAADDLRRFAEARLIEDVSDFLGRDSGLFVFTEGKVPGGIFDPEERYQKLSLQAGPILFESARRKDHWPLLRARIGSDATYYVAEGQPEQGVFEGSVDLAREILARLDGSRSVREVMRSFPHCRFACYETLAHLVAGGLVRPVDPEDLVRLARELAGIDPQRALRALRDGLEGRPQHEGLLRELANLAVHANIGTTAADALKMLAHLALERGDQKAARSDLNRARELAPNDTGIRERCLDLALADGRTEDAIAEGLALVTLLRKPGLHAKAVEVLEKLVRADPENWDLRLELAASQVECGNPTLAISDLAKFGKKLLVRGQDKSAREVYRQILVIQPGNENAKRTIELIDSQEYERRREKRRRFTGQLKTIAIAVPLGLGLVFDVAARLAYSDAQSLTSELQLIESRRYDDARELFQVVRDEYPYTLTAQLTARRHLEQLARRSAERRD